MLSNTLSARFIRARFLAALPANFHRFCQDLDKVVDDLNTHRSAIFAKLASLLHEIWDSQQPNMNWVKMSTTQGAKQVRPARSLLAASCSSAPPAAPVQS